MKDRLKVHPIDVPKEIIAWFFKKAYRLNLQVELVEVVGITILRVDVVYRKHQRLDMMKLIEGVDEYFFDEQERQLQEL